MLHEPAGWSGKDNASARKTRLGAWMFLVYAVIYGGFVAINVVKPLLMEKEVILGLNLAVVYGFGLIIFALVLAFFYNGRCNKYERRFNNDEEEGN